MKPWREESTSSVDGQGAHSQNCGHTLSIYELNLVEATTKNLNIHDPTHVCKKMGLKNITNLPSAWAGANYAADRREALQPLHFCAETRFLLWRERKPEQSDLGGGQGGCKRVPLRQGGRTIHHSPKPKLRGDMEAAIGQ